MAVTAEISNRKKESGFFQKQKKRAIRLCEVYIKAALEKQIRAVTRILHLRENNLISVVKVELLYRLNRTITNKGDYIIVVKYLQFPR